MSGADGPGFGMVLLWLHQVVLFGNVCFRRTWLWYGIVMTLSSGAAGVPCNG